MYRPGGGNLSQKSGNYVFETPSSVLSLWKQSTREGSLASSSLYGSRVGRHLKKLENSLTEIGLLSA